MEYPHSIVEGPPATNIRVTSFPHLIHEELKEPQLNQTK